jgi:hypothetical protein
MIVVNMHNQVQGIVTRDDLVRSAGSTSGGSNGDNRGAGSGPATSGGSSGQTDARGRRRANRAGRSRMGSNSPVVLAEPIERAHV